MTLQDSTAILVPGDKSVFHLGIAAISKKRLVYMYHSETDSKIKRYIKLPQ